MRLFRITRCLVLFLCMASGSSEAAQPSTTGGIDLPCQGVEYHQFDFWLGNWESLDPKGVVQGHSSVQKVLGGCALQEWWLGTDGAVGSSFSIFDLSRRIWNQTWVSNHGTLLPIEGYKVGESILLIGFHSGPDGERQLHRTIWTPLPNGKVHQVWDVSEDGGKSWNIIYDGFLRRTSAPFDKSVIDRPGPR